MIAFLGRLLAPFALKIAVGLAIAGAVAAVLLGARQSGKTAARFEGAKDQLKNVRTRTDVENDLGRASDADRKRLRDRWTRD